MEWVFNIFAAAMLGVGCLFALTGSVGVVRMPDFYTRLHPAGKSDTLAQGLILMGLATFALKEVALLLIGPEHGGAHGGAELISAANVILKLVLLTMLLFLTAPTATHAISKAARLDRHTQLPADADPGVSRISHISVAGDGGAPLSEAAGPTLDIRELAGDPTPESTPPEEES